MRVFALAATSNAESTGRMFTRRAKHLASLRRSRSVLLRGHSQHRVMTTKTEAASAVDKRKASSSPTHSDETANGHCVSHLPTRWQQSRECAGVAICVEIATHNSEMFWPERMWRKKETGTRQNETRFSRKLLRNQRNSVPLQLRFISLVIRSEHFSAHESRRNNVAQHHSHKLRTELRTASVQCATNGRKGSEVSK